MKFSSLDLIEPLLKALEEKGYDKPTPIQSQAIPLILGKRDVIAAAQTGSGKTAGFTLPILHRLAQGKPAKSNQARALILVPTRELAAQVEENVKQYGKYLVLKYAVVFGGVKINPQMIKLRGGVDILVATPGRLMDLHNQNAVRFDQLEILVLDEADRMLDMGFINDIKKILALLPKRRQNLMFSATFSDEIRRLTKQFLHNPAEINVSPKNSTTKSIKQILYPVDKKNKANLLTHLIKKNNWDQVLVFTRTKRGANQLVAHLDKNDITAAPIHGNKSQGARTRALNDFKSNKIKVLVATDLAARGIDINELPHVVNFDLPEIAENYVHRIGRTGRAGNKGEAISLVCADEVDSLSSIESLIGNLIARELIDGFEPKHDVPQTHLKPLKVKKPKKPKKPKSDSAAPTKKTPAKKDHKPSKKKVSSKYKGKKKQDSQSSKPRKPQRPKKKNRQ